MGGFYERTLLPFEWGIIWHAMQSMASSSVTTQVPSRATNLCLKSALRSDKLDASDVLSSIALTSIRRGSSENVNDVSNYLSKWHSSLPGDLK